MCVPPALEKKYVLIVSSGGIRQIVIITMVAPTIVLTAITST